jgi:hypothetical protein
VEVEIPATATIGEPVEVSTPTEDLFAPLIEFGDGESVAGTEASHEYEKAGEYQVTVGGAEVLGYRSSAQRMITILPAGPSLEPEGENPGSQPEQEAQGPVEASVKAAPAAPPSAGPPVADPSRSARCVAAETARLSALRRLRRTGAKLSRAGESQRLAAEKRRQAAALDRARQRVARAC